MLRLADYIVIAFYFVFMTAIGFLMKRFIRNTSDYFRGGGEMLWWIAGAGAFMVSFSAVTFTGMAGDAYRYGPVVLVIFLGNAVGFLINYLWFAPVSRQTRAVTAMEVVRARFGKVSEQFFTWLQIPLGTLSAGLWLMGLCVFVSAGFGMPLNTTIIITGVVVVIMALLGGSWSIMAGDFMQMLVLLPVTVVAAVSALVKVGGIGEFVARTPTHFWNWGEAANINLVYAWIVITLLQKFISTNSMTDCSRYLSVKDSVQARKAAMLGCVLFIVGPAVWFIPPMAARILYPDLAAVFPELAKQGKINEAAYFAIAINTLPVGMTGLLLSGIFGATMSSMDGGLNKNAGFFVKNFYQPYLAPHASERQLLLASKVTTCVLGALIIAAGIAGANIKNLTIFEMTTYLGGLVGVPASVPLVLGLFIRRAPSWAGWSTVLVGLAVSLTSAALLTPDRLTPFLGHTPNGREAYYWNFAATTFLNVLLPSLYFLATCAIGYRTTTSTRTSTRPAATSTPPGGAGSTQATAAQEGRDYATLAAIKDLPEHQRIPALFTLMKTPVDFHAEESSAGSDNAQARLMGLLALIYGGFVTLLAFIPNPLTGRLAFVFCGGSMLVIGFLLHRAGTRGHRLEAARLREQAAAPAAVPPGDVAYAGPNVENH